MANRQQTSEAVVTIRRKRWLLRFVSNLGRDAAGHRLWGDCDPPNKRGKTIRILRGLNPHDELDTLIHEALHAGSWDLSEDSVNELARDIARLLWRVGWRRE